MSKSSFLKIIGMIITAVTSILTLGVLSGAFDLQYLASSILQKLAFVSGIVLGDVMIGGLSEQSANWFGGTMIAALYLIGGYILVKAKNVALPLT